MTLNLSVMRRYNLGEGDLVSISPPSFSRRATARLKQKRCRLEVPGRPGELPRCAEPSTPWWDAAPGELCLLGGCGVENTPRWVSASGLPGTGRRTSGDLELVCNEAVQSWGRRPGKHTPYALL